MPSEDRSLLDARDLQGEPPPARAAAGHVREGAGGAHPRDARRRRSRAAARQHRRQSVRGHEGTSAAGAGAAARAQACCCSTNRPVRSIRSPRMPCSGSSPISRASRGLAVLLSSHRLEEIEALQSYALLLDRGRCAIRATSTGCAATWNGPWLEFVFSGTRTALRVAAMLVGYGHRGSDRGGGGSLQRRTPHRRRRAARRARASRPARGAQDPRASRCRCGTSSPACTRLSLINERSGLVSLDSWHRAPPTSERCASSTTSLRRIYGSTSSKTGCSPLTTALRYIAVFVPVVMYFFQADFLGTQAQYRSHARRHQLCRRPAGRAHRFHQPAAVRAGARHTRDLPGRAGLVALHPDRDERLAQHHRHVHERP